MPMRTTIGTKGSSSVIVKSSGLTAITVFLRMPDEHPQILEREVGYIFPLMEVEPTICIELKNEEDEG